MGKRTKDNIKANQVLWNKFFEKFYPEPPRCEAKVSKNCTYSWGLEFHHWPKKSKAIYVNSSELLHDLKHVVLVCRACHHVLDVKDQSLNEPLFKRLRE